MQETEPAPRGEISVKSALLAAQAHEAALTELYGRLRASGHAYAASTAYAASEAVHDLVQELSAAAGPRPVGSEEKTT